MESTSVEQTLERRRRVGPDTGRRAVLPRREQPETPRAPHPTESVDGPRTDRIVDPQILEQVDAEDDDHTGNRADTDRAERRHPVARTRNRDESREEAGDRDARVVLLG